MSKWSRDSDERAQRINAALIVGEFTEYSAVDYLGHSSDRDPFEIEGYDD